MKPHNTSRLLETEPTMGRVSLGPISSESSGQRKLKLDPSIHLNVNVVIAVDSIGIKVASRGIRIRRHKEF